MLTAMTEEDWTIVLQVFDASRSRRSDKGRDDRRFLEALHYFVVHNITWRALPEKFGHWNSVWKRFWRLSRTETFEAFFDALAAMSETAHLVQMFELHRGARACFGGRRKRGQNDQALGRSRGGFSTKIHLKGDLDGLPLAFHLTGGEASDSRNFEILLNSGEAARGFLFLELDLGIAKLKPIKFFAALSMSGAKKSRLFPPL